MAWPICQSCERARFNGDSHRQFLIELRHPYSILRERLPLENLTFSRSAFANQSEKARFSGEAFTAAVAFGHLSVRLVGPSRTSEGRPLRLQSRSANMDILQHHINILDTCLIFCNISAQIDQGIGDRGYGLGVRSHKKTRFMVKTRFLKETGFLAALPLLPTCEGQCRRRGGAVHR